MSVQIQLRRGTALQWSTVNPILAIGEMALELDSHQFKLGNGVDHWNDLPYGGIAGSSGNPLKVEMITVTPLMITNGQLTLSQNNASPSETLLFLDGGVIQKYGIDFTVVGNVLSWTGLGLETIISSNDVLIIEYKY